MYDGQTRSQADHTTQEKALPMFVDWRCGSLFLHHINALISHCCDNVALIMPRGAGSLLDPFLDCGPMDKASSTLSGSAG
jgi:hypothetical protein